MLAARCAGSSSVSCGPRARARRRAARARAVSCTRCSSALTRLRDETGAARVRPGTLARARAEVVGEQIDARARGRCCSPRTNRPPGPAMRAARGSISSATSSTRPAAIGVGAARIRAALRLRGRGPARARARRGGELLVRGRSTASTVDGGPQRDRPRLQGVDQTPGRRPLGATTACSRSGSTCSPCERLPG